MEKNVRAVLVAGVVVLIYLFMSTIPTIAQDLKKEGRYWVAELENSFKVGSGGTLEMDDINGDVIVTSWDKNEVYILEKRRMDVFTKSEAEEAVKRTKVGYSKSGDDVIVDGEEFHRRWMQSVFNVKVPKKYNVDINTSGGDVSVEFLEGTVTLKTSGGDMEVNDIVGDVKLKTSGGDIEIDTVDGFIDASTSGGDISVTNISNRAELSTSGGDIELSEIGGEVKASTSGGDITLLDSEGSASVHTSGGDIELVNVGGEVVAKTSGGDVSVRKSTGSVEASTAGGDIELKDIGGPLSAKTAGGDIEADGVDGGVSCATAGGDIDLQDVQGFIDAKTAGGDISGEITLKDFSKDHHVDMETAGGDVVLYIPADMPATFDVVLKITERAREDYNVYSDFPLSISQEKGNGWGRNIDKVIIAKGKVNGGGDLIKIETTNGNIEIKKTR